MTKGIMLWIIWLLALTTGVFGMGMVYEGIAGKQLLYLLYGLPVLLVGIWVTGNVLASAKRSYRQHHGR
jgi:hypothetical protein